MTEKSYNEKWQNALISLKNSVNSVSFDTWFAPLILSKVDEPNGLIYFDVFNPLIPKVIKDRYMKTLENVIIESFGSNLKIIFQQPSADKPKHTSAIQENEFNEEVIFNPKFTFDNFVVGDHNKYAQAAAYAVAESPSSSTSPLFIYGDSGLGKTHLMHAIGCHIMQHHPELKILYVSAEMFTNELIETFRDTSRNNSKMRDFKNKYRTQDVLLVDDVQFIEKKDRVVEELFYTFNTLQNNNKQVVFSSDRPPNKLTNIDERLKSRFEANLIADIQPPDFETRVAILKTKAELEGVELNEDVNEVIWYIAEKIKYNVRELEGALTRTIALTAMMNEEITMKSARRILKDLNDISDNDITPDIIKKTVCSHFGLKPIDMESSKRSRNVAFPRQIAMYLCREMIGLSFPKIGEEFGGRDHTTVIHAYDKISGEILNNEETKKAVEDIEKLLSDD